EELPALRTGTPPEVHAGRRHARSMTGLRSRYNPRMPTESSRAAADACGLRPGGAVVGRVRLPASKSIAQRAIVCAGLAQGTTEIAQLSAGAGTDVRAALALVAAAGAKVETPSEDRVRITGLPPGLESGWAASSRVSAGESGTLARFATAAFALCG